MEKLKKGEYALRANVKLGTISKVKQVRAALFLEGKDLTIAETIEHIILNFKIK